MDSATSNEYRLLLLLVVFSAGTAMLLQYRNKPHYAICLLTLAALVLRLLAAFLDPFLNDWDEVFHAIVAKNMIAHPLTPMLYTETAMPLDTNWSRQHYWLHKPPFFLWQMAISLKIFGLHAWAVRIPSALWMTALVPVLWRMGCLLRDQRTGFVAAVLVAFAYLPQELTSGALNTDHNDAVFIAVVASSWWAWLELVRSPHWKWAVLAGLLAACAVLTKWYIGACVFLPWGLWVLHGRFAWVRTKGMLLAAAVMLLPVLAWVLHIIHWFPQEAAHEWSFKAEHFSVPMDGHRGTAMFHFDVIADLVPPFTWWIVLPALAWLVWQTREAPHRIFLVSLVIAVHAFFMLAQTKMVCYTMVLFPLYAIAVGNALLSVCALLPWERFRHPCALLATAILAHFTLNFERTAAKHSVEPSPLADHRWRVQYVEVMRDIPRLERFVSQAEKPVVFNMHMNHHLRFMFATGVEAWAWPPTEHDVARLNAKGYTVFLLQDGGLDTPTTPGAHLVPDSVFALSRDVRLGTIRSKALTFHSTGSPIVCEPALVEKPLRLVRWITPTFPDHRSFAAVSLIWLCGFRPVLLPPDELPLASCFCPGPDRRYGCRGAEPNDHHRWRYRPHVRIRVGPQQQWHLHYRPQR